MIRYKCDSCGTFLETDDALGGTMDTCPACGATSRVPLSKRQKAYYREEERLSQAKLRAERQLSQQATDKTVDRLVPISHIALALAVIAAIAFVVWYRTAVSGKLSPLLIPAIAVGCVAAAIQSVAGYFRFRQKRALKELTDGWDRLHEQQEATQAAAAQYEQERLAQAKTDERERTAKKEADERERTAKREADEREIRELRELCHQERETLDIAVREKTQGFPWFAKALSSYSVIRQLEEAERLDEKSHPAPRAADKVREIAKARRAIEEKLRISRAMMEYWMCLFPFLEDFLGSDVNEELLRRIIEQDVEQPVHDVSELNVDPVILLLRLPREEYERLSSVERNQLALDKWRNRSKSKWQVGRNYERYIGYLYECDGFRVSYQGILEGYEDLGRDLIATKRSETQVIQCKRWAQHKLIHEKHVNQLFGTAVKYIIEHPGEEVSGVLYVTNRLSETAMEFARHLHITVFEDFPYDDHYPLIKCNISRSTGEKIYHLPFDQQYDRTVIEPRRGECYVATVAEAEERGFRRAWRWHPDTED